MLQVLHVKSSHFWIYHKIVGHDTSEELEMSAAEYLTRQVGMLTIIWMTLVLSKVIVMAEERDCSRVPMVRFQGLLGKLPASPVGRRRAGAHQKERILEAF